MTTIMTIMLKTKFGLMSTKIWVNYYKKSAISKKMTMKMRTQQRLNGKNTKMQISTTTGSMEVINSISDTTDSKIVLAIHLRLVWKWLMELKRLEKQQLTTPKLLPLQPMEMLISNLDRTLGTNKMARRTVHLT